MVRVSNAILAIFCCLTLVIGFATMGYGLYIFVKGSTTCDKLMENSMLIVGAAISVVSLLGLIGSGWRINLALMLYLILMFLLILGLIAFAIFSILVTNEDVGKVLSRAKVMDFNNWLSNQFADEKHWNEIRSCLAEAGMCKSLAAPHHHAENKLSWPSPRLQSGCCQPPIACGFISKNATFWDQPKTNPTRTMQDSDCTTWSNQQNTLCYNCESCKEAHVASIRKEWGSLAILNVCFIAFTVIFYSIGCCARLDNKFDSYSRYY